MSWPAKPKLEIPINAGHLGMRLGDRRLLDERQIVLDRRPGTAATWDYLLPHLAEKYELSDESILFHRLWHFDIQRPAAETDKANFHLFHGSIFALHPACGNFTSPSDRHRPKPHMRRNAAARGRRVFALPLLKFSRPVRTAIESDWAQALARIQELDNLLAEEQARSRQVEDLLDSQEVIEPLQHFDLETARAKPAIFFR